MNPKVKAKWLKALRSGEYDQTREKLLRRTSKGDKFCCLGVLCNLYAQEHLGTGFRLEDLSFFNSVFELPSEVADWAMLEGHLIEDISMDALAPTWCRLATTHLAYMNDEAGKNFNEIANWIEENL